MEYNVVFEARSAGELAAHECSPAAYKPSRFLIDRVRVMECIAGRARNDRRYVALRPYRARPGRSENGRLENGQPNKEEMPEIAVIVDLLCPRGDCDRYSRQLGELFNKAKSIPVSTVGAPQ